MTPCEEKGYKVGDRFIANEVEAPFSFKTGEVVILTCDDGSTCPGFESEVSGDKGFAFLYEVSKIEPKQEWNGEGLPPVEWKNGDECIYNGELYVYQCVASWDSDACILSGKSRNSHSLTDAWIEELSKPETPQQREERERLEVIHQMVDDFNDADMDYNLRGKVAKVCAALYDSGYRKAK